jgi:DNA-binding transcriptional ArsR family regulator
MVRRPPQATIGSMNERSIGVASPDSLPDGLVELVAERFRALGEPMRIRLLERLRHDEASVLDLARALDSTPQNVSKHLGVLLRTGIVARRKEGNFSYYSVADDAVFELCATVCGSVERNVESLRRIVTSATGVSVLSRAR